MKKLPTLPSTTSTVCPDISAGSGGNVQETSCSKLKTLRRWRLIITFVNDINRGGNSVIKCQWKTSDEFAVVHPPTTRATLLWQSPSSKSKESLRVTEKMIFWKTSKWEEDHFQPQILYYISFLRYFGVFVVYFLCCFSPSQLCRTECSPLGLPLTPPDWWAWWPWWVCMTFVSATLHTSNPFFVFYIDICYPIIV